MLFFSKKIFHYWTWIDRKNHFLRFWETTESKSCDSWIHISRSKLVFLGQSDSQCCSNGQGKTISLLDSKENFFYRNFVFLISNVFTKFSSISIKLLVNFQHKLFFSRWLMNHELSAFCLFPKYNFVTSKKCTNTTGCSI